MTGGDARARGLARTVIKRLDGLALGSPSAGWYRNLTRPLRGSWLNWGDLRRLQPFCDDFGASRGVPVDRFYIDRFMLGNAHLLKGDVLEVEEPRYVRRHAAPGARAHILDIDAANPRADTIADLCVPGSLGARRYDAVVLTQVLQLLREPVVALGNLWTSLRPGGHLLITVPTMSKLAYGERPGTDFWRWTPDGLRRTLAVGLPPEAEVLVTGHGNVLACVAYLMGLSLADVSAQEMLVEDPVHPLIVTARVRRPEG